MRQCPSELLWIIDWIQCEKNMKHKGKHKCKWREGNEEEQVYTVTVKWKDK